MVEYPTSDDDLQASDVALRLAQRLVIFLQPMLISLDTLVDRRLVRTLRLSVAAIIQFRNRADTLLLSELGGYILDPEHAPAGTKRLSRLLHSAKWTASFIERHLSTQAEQHLSQLEQAGQDAYLLWDESVIEKPESITLEGLSSVRSSKAARLTRIKKGYYQPPKGKVFVPGMHWLAVLLAGSRDAPSLAAMQWWTTRGEQATTKRAVAASLLGAMAEQWGQRVIHIFDRGFAGSPWLGRLVEAKLRFVMRWPKGYKLLDVDGDHRLAWQITRGKRSWQSRQLWDSRHQCWHKASVLAVRVAHPDYALPLWLVVSRPGKGQSPWYLLTNEAINS